MQAFPHFGRAKIEARAKNWKLSIRKGTLATHTRGNTVIRTKLHGVRKLKGTNYLIIVLT